MKSEVFLTIISGTMVYVSGQIIQKFFIEPICELNKTIGKIHNNINYYLNKYVSSRTNSLSSANIKKLNGIFRRLFCDLASKYRQIPCKKIFSLIRIIPSQEKIENVSGGLIYLSNVICLKEMDISENDKRINMICNDLNLKRKSSTRK